MKLEMIGLAACLSAAAWAQGVRATGNRLEIRYSWGTLDAYAVAPDVIRIDTHPKGVRAVPTEMMDLRGMRNVRPVGAGRGETIFTDAIRASVTPTEIRISDSATQTRVSISLEALASDELLLNHSAGENLYGMRGSNRDNRGITGGLLRTGGAQVSAGSQGDGGAPLAYSTHWGVLIDSIDGQFTTTASDLEFSHGSRKDLEAYIVLGPPKRTVEVAAALTGHPPMAPKWALGFMNSQWGTDQNMVLGIVDEYRQRQIPLDGFIFDFDFKAWGEDNYGEWRWNSTSGPGNVGPDKYPDGQSGKFAKLMAARGVHLVGIMKPRALTQTVDLKPTMAAAEATAHGWWMPKKPYTDYFSHRLANDFDFSKPDLRKWFWQHARNLFETGISGWWNDEADDGFDSLGFFHMQESLFEGQQSVSNRRVWSINRNFYLGAQRFAFGTWSGDIRTGFPSMAAQRARMLLSADLGQSHWTMDAGGFNGHPSSENYARWMEFASVVPIMRVHGTYGQRRQPWVYGPVAEAAAKNAIDWRYAMFPSFYSWEHEANRTGIGIVRPLFWEFPDDPQCANTVDEWMLGDQLLVSPVSEQGQTSKQVYFPEGQWYDLKTGKGFPGPDTAEIPCDAQTWADVPMFVRAGSILASQPVEQYMGQRPVEQITLDVWPTQQRTAKFQVYDDDGETRDYEHGAFFAQDVSAKETPNGVEVSVAKPAGSYRTTIRSYKVRIHGRSAGPARWNGAVVPATTHEGTTEVEIPAGQPGRLEFQR